MYTSKKCIQIGEGGRNDLNNIAINAIVVEHRDKSIGGI